MAQHTRFLTGPTATFGLSTTTSLTISSTAQIAQILFNAGAPAYSFAIPGGVTFTISGIGITNNSSNAPTFTIASSGILNFQSTGAVTAGNATITNNKTLNFNADSDAGAATITNNGTLQFIANGTAENASIANNNTLNFYTSSTAGNATITTNAGATTAFYQKSTGGNARLMPMREALSISPGQRDQPTITS